MKQTVFAVVALAALAQANGPLGHNPEIQVDS